MTNAEDMLRSNADLLEFLARSDKYGISEKVLLALVADMREAADQVATLSRKALEAEGKVAVLQSFTETPTDPSGNEPAIELRKIRKALAWVGKIEPEPTANRCAIYLRLESWNAIRKALGWGPYKP